MRILLLLLIPIYLVMWFGCFVHALKTKNVLGLIVMILANPVSPFLYMYLFKGNK